MITSDACERLTCKRTRYPLLRPHPSSLPVCTPLGGLHPRVGTSIHEPRPPATEVLRRRVDALERSRGISTIRIQPRIHTHTIGVRCMRRCWKSSQVRSWSSPLLAAPGDQDCASQSAPPRRRKHYAFAGWRYSQFSPHLKHRTLTVAPSPYSR